MSRTTFTFGIRTGDVTLLMSLFKSFPNLAGPRAYDESVQVCPCKLWLRSFGGKDTARLTDEFVNAAKSGKVNIESHENGYVIRHQTYAVTILPIFKETEITGWSLRIRATLDSIGKIVELLEAGLSKETTIHMSNGEVTTTKTIKEAALAT